MIAFQTPPATGPLAVRGTELESEARAHHDPVPGAAQGRTGDVEVRVTKEGDSLTNLLAHPLVAACVVLTAVNDHLLKAAYPGFLTGKLSDFAGLFFFPFLVAETAARVLPAGRATYLGSMRAACLAGGAVFAAAKTSVPFRDALVEAVTGLGLPIRVACDPGDLVALIVLPLACRFASRRLSND